MIAFVNAKINIGLQVVNRRNDGYHDLQSVFYPVGKYVGSPANPVTFCDILEVLTFSDRSATCHDRRFECVFSGRPIDCPPEKNLIWKAAECFFATGVPEGFNAKIRLDKHLPDGAGMGGGSADAAFVLRLLADAAGRYAADNAINWQRPSDAVLSDMAAGLGADCPFFVLNSPAFASGVGDRLQQLALDLDGLWIGVVKPRVSISTKEAFSGITPRTPSFDLRMLPGLPLNKWKFHVKNDFEDSLFPRFPILPSIKEGLYGSGALYASLTGSGSCIYGIFESEGLCREALASFSNLPTIEETYLLKL